MCWILPNVFMFLCTHYLFCYCLNYVKQTYLFYFKSSVDCTQLFKLKTKIWTHLAIKKCTITKTKTETIIKTTFFFFHNIHFKINDESSLVILKFVGFGWWQICAAYDNIIQYFSVSIILLFAFGVCV